MVGQWRDVDHQFGGAHKRPFRAVVTDNLSFAEESRGIDGREELLVCGERLVGLGAQDEVLAEAVPRRGVGRKLVYDISEGDLCRLFGPLDFSVKGFDDVLNVVQLS